MVVSLPGPSWAFPKTAKGPVLPLFWQCSLPSNSLLPGAAQGSEQGGGQVCRAPCGGGSAWPAVAAPLPLCHWP
eukprot:5825909-Amphidinium_carterae.3